jgi:autophagy-related protein 18
MPLHHPPASNILYMTFNQDYSCISLADYKGIKIYSLNTHKLCYVADIGAVRYPLPGL